MAAVYAATVRYGEFAPDLASSHGMRVTFGLAGTMVLTALLLLCGNGLRHPQRQ